MWSFVLFVLTDVRKIQTHSIMFKRMYYNNFVSSNAALTEKQTFISIIYITLLHITSILYLYIDTGAGSARGSFC